MRRIAFIGIENAGSEVLHDALRRNLGVDAEINAFEKDVAAVTVAPFLVAKNKDTKQLEGKGSVAYISSEADEELAKRIGRLSKAGVTVRTGWSDFKTEASDEEIMQWLASGVWPEPAEDEDDDADLLALLGGDEDDFFGEDEEVKPAAQTSPEPAAADSTEDDEDELPAWNSAPSAPAVSDQEAYPTRRFDSMSANDGAAEPARRTAQVPLPSVVEDNNEDDDDLPLPAFGSSVVQAPAPREESFDSPVSHVEDEDEDELPAFSVPQQRQETAPARTEVNVSFEDEEDDLPAWDTPSTNRVDESNDDAFGDEDDDLPAWGAQAEEPAPQPERSENLGRRRAAEAPAESFDSFDDENDDEADLPQFNFQEPEAPVAETRAGRRAAAARPEIPVIDDGNDDDVDLPVFNPEAFVTEPQAPEPAAQPASRDDEFEDDFDELPQFSAEPEPVEAPAPQRRSRRDFLAAAESLARQNDAASEDDNDDDGDELPEFAPQFTPPPVDADDELPVPMRRASVSNDEAGDDLPEFVTRVTDKHEDEDDEDEEDSFTFAPKVQTPSYAAPADKQPEWGVPVQRDEVIARTPRREEPKPKRVAPEKVRYENDVPSEVAAEQAERRRRKEGYEQPVIEQDVPDRELRPAPGASPELRPAQRRVVNQRPAAPVEPEETLDFMAGADEEDDDFNPNATPPFMESLKPEQRRAQSTMEQIRREYDSDSALKVRAKGSAITYYITGSHGGAGKTTSTWMMANTMAGALKKDPSRPVFLIEGDYENSKLAQRLNLPPEKNSGKLAELYRKLSNDRSLISKQKINMVDLTERIIKESIFVNDHGVNIIAAPYDLTKRDGRFLRMAIQKSVEYAERQGGYVFIDADTLSNDDILDRTLAAKATHVIVVSFGDKDHVDDTHRAIHTLTTPNVKAVSNSASTNGMGIPKDRIKLFFNKTGGERFEDLQRIMRPYITEGHLPTVQGLNDGGWIGNLTGGDFLNAVTSYASFMNRISPMEELRPYESRRPQKATQRSGFMKMFGSRR